MKNLLTLLDLSRQEIYEILDLADKMKYDLKHGLKHDYLRGKTLAMIFAKASTRTRVSFETGIFQLGGHGVLLSMGDTQMGRGEPVKDTARVLGRYCDGIMIRTFAQAEIEEYAEYAGIPVINALTDMYHPCQILADLMTIREHKQTLEGLRVAWVGDGNNVANSLIIGALKTGMRISVATPEGYEPDPLVMDFAHGFGEKFQLTHSPEEAAEGADAVFADVWASMGQEEESKKRAAAFQGKFQVNAALMAHAKPDAMVQHCLPAHRGEEITADVFEAHAGEIFDEAENRLHAQKAVMTLLMADSMVLDD